MQQEQFDNLTDRVTARMQEALPEAKPGGVASRIRREFEAVRDNGELLTLSRDEVRLLYDYRLWKKSADGAVGVFHWKKPPKAILDA